MCWHRRSDVSMCRIANVVSWTLAAEAIVSDGNSIRRGVCSDNDDDDDALVQSPRSAHRTLDRHRHSPSSRSLLLCHLRSSVSLSPSLSRSIICVLCSSSSFVFSQIISLLSIFIIILRSWRQQPMLMRLPITAANPPHQQSSAMTNVRSRRWHHCDQPFAINSNNNQ